MVYHEFVKHNKSVCSLFINTHDRVIERKKIQHYSCSCFFVRWLITTRKASSRTAVDDRVCSFQAQFLNVSVMVISQHITAVYTHLTEVEALLLFVMYTHNTLLMSKNVPRGIEIGIRVHIL